MACVQQTPTVNCQEDGSALFAAPNCWMVATSVADDEQMTNSSQQVDQAEEAAEGTALPTPDGEAIPYVQNSRTAKPPVPKHPLEYPP